MTRSQIFVSFLVLVVMASRAHCCETESISVLHESGFFSLFNSNSDEEAANSSLKINIPVTTETGNGCFSLTSHLNLSVKTSKNSSGYEIDFSPMKAEAENISDFRVKNLIRFIDNENPSLAKISVISYACAGENVLAVEYYQGNIANFLKAQNKSDPQPFSNSTFIATGPVYKNLRQIKELNLEADAEALINTDFTLDQPVFNSDLTKYFVKPIVPDVLVSEKISGRYVTLRHSIFSNGDKVLNLCNPSIALLFREYSLDNFNEQLVQNSAIEIKNKKNGVVIKKGF